MAGGSPAVGGVTVAGGASVVIGSSSWPRSGPWVEVSGNGTTTGGEVPGTTCSPACTESAGTTTGGRTSMISTAGTGSMVSSGRRDGTTAVRTAP
jgi:hypothetical protein